MSLSPDAHDPVVDVCAFETEIHLQLRDQTKQDQCGAPDVPRQEGQVHGTDVFCNNKILEEIAEAWKNELRLG
jgi:hypothetical protein